MEDKTAFYKNLKEKLDESNTYPAIYMYKFIVPTNKNQVAEVKEIFSKIKSKINTKASKNGNYESVSIVINASASDQIIKYYKAVAHIEGLISL